MSDNLRMPQIEPIEDLQKRMEEVFKIDPINLDTEALRQTNIFFTVQNELHQSMRIFRKANAVFNKFRMFRINYYMGRLPDEVYKKTPLKYSIQNKGDLEIQLKADEMYMEMQDIIDRAEANLNFLESCINQLKSRGFDVRNAIEFRKLNSGE